MIAKVSVIIPVYNASNYVAKAINSVLAQGYNNYEIIVVDDGSTDETREVLNGYEDRIRYVYQNNAGPAKARNTGIKQARGDYITFLDADDLWLPDKLEKQLSFFNIHPQYSLVFTDMQHIVGANVIHKSYLKEKNYQYLSSGSIYENLLRECFIFTPTVMVKRECLERVGFFNENLRIAEDYDLWLRIADKFQIGFLDQPLVIRNRHKNNLTEDRYLYIISGIQMMEELYRKDKGSKRRKKIIEEELGKRYFALGYYFFDLGQQKEAQYNFLKSLKYSIQSIRPLLYLLSCSLPQSVINSIRLTKRRLNRITRKYGPRCNFNNLTT